MCWPFPLINDTRTEESKELMAAPSEKPLSPYQQALLEDNQEEAPF